MQKMDPRRQAFLSYLSYFPVVEPAVNISSSSIQEISKINKALPYELLYEFVFTWRDEKELGEWIPAFSLPSQEAYVPVIIWELDLLSYKCILVSYDHSGHMISHVEIAHLTVDEAQGVNHQAAVIDEDGLIYAMQRGESDQQSESLSEVWQISSDGSIVLSID